MSTLTIYMTFFQTSARSHSMCIDLHTHSVYSDGSSSPLELVESAVAHGIKALALTDHDTMAGSEEILKIGAEKGIAVISGVELSALHGELSLHILGYGIDLNNSDFTNWLFRLQSGREERNRKILLSLQQAGIHVTLQELQEVSERGLTGRPHIANILIQKGVVRSFHEAFRSYLGKGQKAWHRRFCYTAMETIKAIHLAGGIAVLAHPGQLDPNMKIQPALVRELALHGLDGIEAYYPSHSRKIRKKLSALAANNKLVVTGGSDYHGATRPANMLAGSNSTFCPPVALLDPIFERIERYRS